jgi:hypothetical protein
MGILRYVSNRAELEKVCEQAKQWACPHCGALGTLNWHGLLFGSSDSGKQRDEVRGRRLFCSNRWNRGGCGHSFSVLLSSHLRRAFLRAGALWEFYLQVIVYGNVHAAFATGGFPLSLQSAYRWWQRLRTGQHRLRELLCRVHDPPTDAPVGVFAALLSHVQKAFGNHNAIERFQEHFQEAWPG